MSILNSLRSVTFHRLTPMLLGQILSLVIALIRKVKSIKHIKHLFISNMKARLFVQYRKHFPINTRYTLKSSLPCFPSAPSPQKRSSVALVNCWINITASQLKNKQTNKKTAAHNKGMLRLNQFHVKIWNSSIL